MGFVGCASILAHVSTRFYSRRSSGIYIMKRETFDIVCSKQIPIMGYTAYRTSPTTHRKSKIMINISTSTHLRRRFKPTYSENIYAVFLRLVFKQGVETAYGNIFKNLCKMMILNHIAYSKCFKTDSVILRNKFMCNLMEKIVPLIRNSFMRPCKSYSCTFSILGTFGFMRKGALQSFDFLDRTFQIFMVRYFRTIGKNGKRLDTKVNPNRFAFADWFCLCILFVHFYKYRNEIFVSRSPCDNGCLDTTFKLSVEASLYSFLELGDIDLAFIVIHSCVLRNGKTLAIFLLGLELWEALLFTEELYESGVKVGKCGLQGKRINLGKPTVFLRLLHRRQFGLDLVSGNVCLVFLIGFHFLVKSVVIQKATTTKMLCYKHLLPFCRVNSVFIRLVFHIAKVQNNLEIAKEMSKKYAIHPHKLKTCGISC